MRNQERTQVCRKCGKPIAIISWGIYRKSIVDAVAIMVRADACGEEFVRIDGSKVQGREVPFDSGEIVEPAYRQHRCGRKKK